MLFFNEHWALWAALASYFSKKIVGTKTIVAIAGSMIGIAIMFSQGLETANSLGNLIILGVPICFALQLTLINRRSDVTLCHQLFFLVYWLSLLAY